MKKRFWVLIVLVLFSIITYLDRTSISITGIEITKDLHLSEKQFGWIMGSFAFAYGIFEIPMGLWGDLKGPKSVLFRIVLSWSVFTILTGYSYTFTGLFIIRFLFGLGEAGAYPNATIVINTWFPKQEAGRAQSFIWIASRVGAAIAPFIALYIMSQWGWRYVFYIFGCLGILWSVFWYFWFQNEPKNMPGISSDELTHIEKGREQKINYNTWQIFQTVLKTPNVWALMGMYHCLLYGAYFYLSWMPKYLKNGKGVDDLDLAFLASLPFILGTIGCFSGGFLSDYLAKKTSLKWGRRAVGMFGLVMSGICMIASTFVVDLNTSIIVLAFGLAFKDFTLPVSWATSADIGGQHSGVVAGAMGMAGQLGSTVMSIAFGYILAATGSWDMPVRIIGGVVILGGLLWLGINPEKKIVF